MQSSDLHHNRNGLVAHTEYVTLQTDTRYAILDVTERVNAVRMNARLCDGYILVSTMHITSSICERSRQRLMVRYYAVATEACVVRRRFISVILPVKTMRMPTSNGSSLATQVIVPVTGSRLDLGPCSESTMASLTVSDPNACYSKRLASRVASPSNAPPLCASNEPALATRHPVFTATSSTIAPERPTIDVPRSREPAATGASGRWEIALARAGVRGGWRSLRRLCLHVIRIAESFPRRGRRAFSPDGRTRRYRARHDAGRALRSERPVLLRESQG